MVVKKRSNSSSPDALKMDSSSERLASSSASAGFQTILPLHRLHSSTSDGERSPSGSPQSFRRANRKRGSGSSSDSDHSRTMTLPTWSANPQAPGDLDNPGGLDSSNHHLSSSSPNNNNNNSTGYFSTSQHYNRRQRIFCLPTCKWVVLGGAFLALMVTVLQSRFSLIYSLEEVAQLMHNGGVLRSKLTDAERGIKLLQREVLAHDIMRMQPPTQPTSGGAPMREDHPRNRALVEMRQLSDRLQQSQKKADTLKQRVQELSRSEALAKYGDGIHHVEILLSFPDGRPGPTRFVIQMAPLDLMPHSVHFFLEMVSSGLLDGCSFILNALHVLKAAPLPYDGSSASNKVKDFAKRGLESVAFKEYQSSYPHEQYTVGFAADGSPSFYINTEDNSEIHLGDPCFGKIVEGFETVKRLEASPTRNGIWFEQRIGIKKATVLM